MTQKFNPVCWFEVYVQDMPRAKEFYQGVFQCQLEQLPSPGIEMWAFGMDANGSGASGSLVKMPGMASGGNSSLVYFACEDCAVEEARVSQFGGKVERPKMSIGEYGFISLVTDTEGNMIGLFSEK